MKLGIFQCHANPPPPPTGELAEFKTSDFAELGKNSMVEHFKFVPLINIVVKLKGKTS